MIELFADDDDFEAELERRIRDLKQNPDGLLSRFDINGDGVLDAVEWRAIRNLLRREIAESQAHDEPIATVGDYQVLSKIRPGASGYASIARSPDGTLVVLKQLRLNHAESWHESDRFRREADILGDVSDHRIPGFVDAFETSDPPGFVIVQELVEGEDLELSMERGAVFNEDTIVDIARQSLRLLAYLHNLRPGVVHRDVKPSNLIVDDAGEIHLVDFGGAYRIGDEPADLVATAGYAAPEQIMGRPSPAVDIYGLGATLVHLATGRDPAELEATNLKLEWEQYANLSPRIVRAIDRMIEPDPARRFRTATEAEEVFATKAVIVASETQLPISKRVSRAAPGLVKRAPSGLEVNWTEDFLSIEYTPFSVKHALPLRAFSLAMCATSLTVVFLSVAKNLFLGLCGLAAIGAVLMFLFTFQGRRRLLVQDNFVRYYEADTKNDWLIRRDHFVGTQAKQFRDTSDQNRWCVEATDTRGQQMEAFSPISRVAAEYIRDLVQLYLAKDDQ